MTNVKTLRLSDLLLAVLVTLIWGFNFTVIKVGLDGLPPVFLCFLRFFFSAVPAVFFLPRPNVPLRKIAAYGFVIFACQFALLFVGMHYGMSAGLASIVLQMQVFVTIALSVVIMHERPLKSQVLGAVIAFAGIVVIGVCAGGNVSALGFFLVLLAACAWGWGNMMARSICGVNILVLVVWASLFASAPLGLLSLVMEGRETIGAALVHINWLSAGAVLYLAYGATLFGYGVWSNLIIRYQVATIAPVTLLVPVFGLSCAAVFLGESLPFWKVEATLMVLLGLVINLCGPRLKKKSAKCEIARRLSGAA